MREPYEKLNGVFLANFIEGHLNLCFAKAGPKNIGKTHFIMDNGLMSALQHTECELCRIPAGPPYVNPIEYIFDMVKEKLEEEATISQITKKCFENFQEQVFGCLDNIGTKIVDPPIVSTTSRKGKRHKY